MIGRQAFVAFDAPMDVIFLIVGFKIADSGERNGIVGRELAGYRIGMVRSGEAVVQLHVFGRHINWLLRLRFGCSFIRSGARTG